MRITFDRKCQLVVNWSDQEESFRFLVLVGATTSLLWHFSCNEVKVVDVLFLFHFPDLKLCQVRKRDKRLTSCEVVFHFTKKVTDTNLTEARLIYNVNIDIMISGDPALE